jgi:hypothetical protein
MFVYGNREGALLEVEELIGTGGSGSWIISFCTQ